MARTHKVQISKDRRRMLYSFGHPVWCRVLIYAGSAAVWRMALAYADNAAGFSIVKIEEIHVTKQ